MKTVKFSRLLFAVVLALGAHAAHAVLARVGPSDLPAPPGNGFPAWYQDSNGVALDLCNPTTQAQVTPCLLAPAPGDPNPTLPFAFPTNWPDEQFYYAWSASQNLTLPDGSGILVEGAIEAAFATGGAAIDQQITFSRIRIRFDPQVSGNYTIRHPGGVDVLPGTAGQRVFFTEDVGVAGGGVFTGAMQGRNGPWLAPVTRVPDPANPGQFIETPIAPTIIDGRRFLTDGAVEVQVANGVNNFVEVCTDALGGLDGNIATPNDECVRTDLFTVVGMLHEGNIASPMAVDRATYRRDSASSQIDVFATATPGIGQPAANLSFTGTAVNVVDLPAPVDCAAVPALFAPVPMTGPNLLNNFYGQAGAPVPTFVTVTNSGDVPATCVSARVVDEVNIVSALYDRTAGTLTVRATSSDWAVPPVLTLDPLPGGTAIAMTPVGGADPTLSEAVITGVTLPLPKVTVQSAAGGVDTEAITTTFVAPPPGNAAPVAVNDSYTTAEDVALVVAGPGVLGNDSDAENDPLIAVKVTDPVSGTLALSADGSFVFTPAPNFSGLASFTYVAQQTTPSLANSNVATVTINVTPVNDAPVAVADAAVTTVSVPVTVNVLANDTDVDSPVLTVTAAGPVAPAGAGTVSIASPNVTFTPAAGFIGQASFPYTVSDGALSASATVTVDVSGVAETLTIATAQFRTGQARWVVLGTSNLTSTHAADMTLIRGGATVGTIATNVPVVAGAFSLDLRGSPLVAQTNDIVRVTSTSTGAFVDQTVVIRR